MALADASYALVEVGRDEHADGVLEVAQHVVGATAYEHARVGFGRLAYGVALKLEQTLLRQLVVVEVAVRHERGVHVEQRAEEAFLLVVLLEKLLAEAALLCGKVEQLLVVEIAPEVVGQALGYYESAAAELPSDVDYYLFVFHKRCLFRENV